MSLYVVKRPGEERTYVFNFADQAEIVGGDTLTGTPTVAETLVTGPSDTLTVGSPSRSGSTVVVEISGGANGDLYHLTCTVNTTAGSILQSVMPMKISTSPGGTVS